MSLTMNFKVSKVLETLNHNRNEHNKILKEAMEKYKDMLLEELSNKILKLKEGQLPNPSSSLVKPQSYLSTYDSAIQMLKMTSDQDVELSQQQFDCFILNKWNWMNSFLITNSTYSSTAASMMEDNDDDEHNLYNNIEGL